MPSAGIWISCASRSPRPTARCRRHVNSSESDKSATLGLLSAARLQAYGAMGAESSGAGLGSGSGAGRGGSGSGSGIGAAVESGSAMAAWTIMRAGADSFTSHSQQSLHRRHFSQRWLSQASLVQRAQIRVDSYSQMLQVNGMGYYFFLPEALGGGVGAIRVARQRWASRSMTANWRSRSAERLTM